MRKLHYLHALALAPLLMGAGTGQVVSELTIDKLPVCAENEYLTYRSGGLSCSAVNVGAKVNWPDCMGQLLTLARNGDVSTLKCTPKGTTGAATNTTLLTSVETKITALGTLVTEIETNPPKAGLGSFAGLSTNTYSGHIKLRAQAYLADVVQDNGILAASNVCAKDLGAGAHICTVPEIFNSALNGKLVRTALMTEDAWIYNASFRNPLGSSPINGLGDNCAGYTYETADAKWVGTSFRWRAAESGDAAGKGDVSPNFFLVGCNTSRKIACCK